MKKKEPGSQFDFRIHIKNLLEYALNGRTMKYAFAAGSVPPLTDELWKRFEGLNIEILTQERGESSKKEIVVDEIIHNRIMGRILDNPPQHLVLLTGDGSGYYSGQGFIKQLERALNHKWTIEVISWDAGVNRNLKEFAQKNGLYRALEPAYDIVTFINNQRWAKPVLKQKL